MKHFISILRRADYYSAALHCRCIARKLSAGKPVAWHIAGIRRALQP